MKKLKVLFVDDDINLGGLVSKVLETDYNFQVHFQNSLIGIDLIIQSLEPDIIILDVEIGDENGIDKAKDIVQKYPLIPILFVSSHTDEDFIVRGIDTGGNAYLPKPFSIPILVSYINRFTTNRQGQNEIDIVYYKLNLLTNELYYKKDLLKKLSPFEKNALELLMKQANEIVKKEQFANKLWPNSCEIENTASLHNTISNLRELFKIHDLIKINTIRGVGYSLNY
jgi:DNA-binding response OmpR family regulator